MSVGVVVVRRPPKKKSVDKYAKLLQSNKIQLQAIKWRASVVDLIQSLKFHVKQIVIAT
jgi:hypothetical protein